MAKQEHQAFEVQVYHSNRWQVHARYPFHERAVALREARELSDERKKLAVRVIMEDYKPDSGKHDEVLVYRNRVDTTQAAPKAKLHKGVSFADMAVSSDGRVGYVRSDVDYYNDFMKEPKEKIKARVTPVMFLWIWFVILGISFLCGVGAAGVLALMIRGFGVALETDAYRIMLLGMLGTVSFIAFMSMLNYYRARFDLNPFGKRKAKPRKVKKSALSHNMDKAAKDIDAVKHEAEHSSQETKKNIFEEADPESLDSYILSTQDDDVEFSQRAEEIKTFMTGFLGNCLGALKGPEASIQSLNRFGLNLFMSGAAVKLSQNVGLSEEETRIIQCRILEMLGAKPEQAERFADEHEKYLHETRHNALFEEGGTIARQIFDGDQAAILRVPVAIQDWTSWKPPEDEKSNPNLLTIMFTDMVGSTDLTTKHGDYAAQEVLKSHDLIVRTALTNFDGREIKHLGDGIMASFKDHDKAIRAAIEIQKRVKGNNDAGPEFPLHVRVSLNAGEPIIKGDDLFGTSVQLAARICDFTPSDKICVSQYLHELCGKRSPYTFVDRGAQSLKGFDNPKVIYEVDWTKPLIDWSAMSAEELKKYDAEHGEADTVDATIEMPRYVIEDPHAPDMDVSGVKGSKAPAKMGKDDFQQGLPQNEKKPQATPEGQPEKSAPPKADDTEAPATPDTTKSA